MKLHKVRTYRSAEPLARGDQLAWKIAEVAADPVRGRERGRRDDRQPHHRQCGGGRGLDRAARGGKREIAGAGPSVCAGRDGIRARPRTQRISPEWAAWANGVAVRELDFHDTFLAADYSHPGDNIPPVLAVGQHCGLSGADLIRGLAAAYEIQIDLVKGICLHEHKIDHIAHLGPSAAAGIGALLGLPTATIYQAVQQALHVTTTTRQSRKGEISSWKAYAPAFAGKMAIESVDRVMRGEGAPSPAYEGEDGFIAWLLGGPKAEYIVPLPEKGEAKRAILDSYTKEHSAEYQSQALIDLARRLGPKIGDLSKVRKHRHPYQPSHPLCDRHRRQRSAEDGPEGEPRNARPFHHVYLCSRARRRRLASRAILCARASRPRQYDRAMAQDIDGRGSANGPAAITAAIPRNWPLAAAWS